MSEWEALDASLLQARISITVEGDAFEAGNLIICEPSFLNLLVFVLCLDVHLANPFGRNFRIQEILLIVECPLVLLAFAFLPAICHGTGLGVSLHGSFLFRDSGILALSMLGRRLAISQASPS